MVFVQPQVAFYLFFLNMFERPEAFTKKLLDAKKPRFVSHQLRLLLVPPRLIQSTHEAGQRQSSLRVAATARICSNIDPNCCPRAKKLRYHIPTLNSACCCTDCILTFSVFTVRTRRTAELIFRYTQDTFGVAVLTVCQSLCTTPPLFPTTSNTMNEPMMNTSTQPGVASETTRISI